MRVSGPLLLLVVFLGACFTTPERHPVSFPDDARVLHGDWVLELTRQDVATQPGAVSATASLSLQAHSLSPDRNSYAVSGAASFPAEPGLPLEASVSGRVTGRLHVFEPAGVGPQAPPPPVTTVRLEFHAEGLEQAIVLSLSTADPYETSMEGFMFGDATRPGYVTLLRR